MEQLLQYFTPEKYQLKLTIDKHKKTREGTVLVFGTAKAETVKLHCVGTEVDYVRADGKDLKYTLKNGVLSVVVGSRRDFNFEVGFHGPLNENMQGAYLSTYKHQNKTMKIVSTQFESHYARECFPCVDEPAAKAEFELEITIPKQDKDLVLSNMPVKEVVKNTTIFETTPRMSTYLLVFVIGEFKAKTVKNEHGVLITTYIPLNQREETLDFANEIAVKSLDYYDDLFKTPYPLKKLDQVAIPDFEAGAMENWGLVTYRESCLLADETSALDTKKSVALTIAHELSHQWFGNLVTMKWWDDLWLNESFASVIEYYAVDKIHPEYNIWEEFFTGSCLSALMRDALYGVQAVKQEVNDPEEISTLFDGAIVYAKGAHLMLMLVRLMTEEKFFAGIREYFKKFAYQNTCGDDLWRALQPFAKFDVKEFMDAWISQPGYPMITDGVAQRFLLSGETDKTVWPLPEVKDDMSGHYLLNLSGPEFAEKLNKFNTLSLEQRLRVLIDRMLLAKTPLVESASLIDLLPEFKDEVSASVWNILLSIIANLKLFFEPESEAEGKFKNFLIELIMPNLNRLGVVPKAEESDNDVRLRPLLLSLAIYAEDATIMEKLAELYDENPFEIHPEIRDFVILAKFKLEETAKFDEYLEKYQNLAEPEVKFAFLCALVSAKKPENIEKLLELLEKPEIVKPQDHLYLYIYLRRNHRAKAAALDWLMEKWDYVEEMTGEKSIEDYPRYTANTILTEDEQAKFLDFFAEKKEQPVLKRTLEVAETEIEARLKLIKLDGPAVFSRLK